MRSTGVLITLLVAIVVGFGGGYLVRDAAARNQGVPVSGGAARATANALVYATVYIAEERDRHPDDDVTALESIAGFLEEASPGELDALAAAAERALQAELRAPSPRKETAAIYRNWMEETLGDPWKGNRRVAPPSGEE